MYILYALFVINKCRQNQRNNARKIKLKTDARFGAVKEVPFFSAQEKSKHEATEKFKMALLESSFKRATHEKRIKSEKY